MRNQSIFWGVILVLFGGLLMAQNLGLLMNINIWAIFWPLMLVLMGVNILLRSSRRGGAHEEALRLPLDGARSARIGLYHGAGELRVSDLPAGDDLLTGTFGGGVEKRVNRSGDEANIDLRVPSENITGFVVPFDGSQGLNWTVGLNPSLPLSINMEVGASRNFLNLRNLQVRELRLQTGASSTEIQMPERAGQTRAWIRSGAAAVEVRVPEGVAARIHAAGGLASVVVDDRRFPRSGNDYCSPDYEGAANRLEIDIETGLGSVNIG